MNRILSIFIFVLWLCGGPSSTHANDGVLKSQPLAYAGKSYKGFQDPEYLSYDLVLRDHMIKKIHQRFGISLDSKTYSGFDLLEIEALFKCKKSNEPFDIFLKMFPKHP